MQDRKRDTDVHKTDISLHQEEKLRNYRRKPKTPARGPLCVPGLKYQLQEQREMMWSGGQEGT